MTDTKLQGERPPQTVGARRFEVDEALEFADTPGKFLVREVSITELAVCRTLAWEVRRLQALSASGGAEAVACSCIEDRPWLHDKGCDEYRCRDCNQRLCNCECPFVMPTTLALTQEEVAAGKARLTPPSHPAEPSALASAPRAAEATKRRCTWGDAFGGCQGHPDDCGCAAPPEVVKHFAHPAQAAAPTSAEVEGALSQADFCAAYARQSGLDLSIDEAALVTLATAIRASRPAQAAAADAPLDRQWRHKKRGTLYTEVGIAFLQTSSAQPLADGMAMMVYRDEDGTLWTRQFDEFHDGRFQGVMPAADAPPDLGQRSPQHTSATALSVVDSWRTIDSAPKDATKMLAVCGLYISIAHWGQYGRSYNGIHGWRDEDGDLWNPTHWMPLPNPPRTEDTQSKGDGVLPNGTNTNADPEQQNEVKPT